MTALTQLAMKTFLFGVLLFKVPAFTNAASWVETESSYFEDDVDSSAYFPRPTGNPRQLFYLQRTPNANTIVYELNLTTNGQLNKEEPLHIFWIRYTEGGIRQELNYIQRHFAYGVKSDLMKDGSYNLTFVAYKKANLRLVYLQQDRKYHVITTLENRPAILSSVYIQIDPGGTFWSPNVRYIELKGKDISTGNDLNQRIIISK